MLIEMETKPREWLEAASLRVANRQIEVRGDLVQVKIRPIVSGRVGAKLGS
jgi:hypothetical protein